MQCPSGLTEAELQVFTDAALLWNAFLKLPVQHPADRQDFMVALNSLQRIILARPTLRTLNELAGQ